MSRPKIDEGFAEALRRCAISYLRSERDRAAQCAIWHLAHMCGYFAAGQFADAAEHAHDSAKAAQAAVRFAIRATLEEGE